MQEEEYRAQLVNFSKYGLCLSVSHPRFVIKKSDLLKDINIKINNTTIYNANGVIVNIEQNNNVLEIGVSLQEETIPVDKILSMSNKDKVAFSYNLLSKDVYVKDRVLLEFKSLVQDFYFLLRNIEHNLLKFENSIKKESLEIRKKLSNEMIDLLEEKVFSSLDEHMVELNNLAKNVRSEDYDEYKLYYQRVLHPLILQSPFINRVYYKPLGYAGDYEIMNMLYANKPKGCTLFAKFVDKYYLSITPSRANRNRLTYIINKIKINALKYLKNNQRIKISSIGCGSCLEIQSLLKTEEISNHIDFTLFDVDKDALNCANKKLTLLRDKYKRQATFTYINESIFNLIKRQEVRDLIEDDQHIIYSLGLFEYLSDVSIRRLLQVLFQKLACNGLLSVGNYSDKNIFKNHMELGGEWFLFYKNKAKMLEMTKAVEEKHNSYVESEPLGSINFLIMEKK
ncbi:class I SAM-dependent methyltransferase family protein [bacterium]